MIFWFIPLLTLILMIVFVALYFAFRPCINFDVTKNKNADWLLKNNASIARIVVSLSYFPIKTKDLSSYERRGKIKLLLELRNEIRRQVPNVEIDFIHSLSKELLLYSECIRKNRERIQI